MCLCVCLCVRGCTEETRNSYRQRDTLSNVLMLDDPSRDLVAFVSQYYH